MLLVVLNSMQSSDLWLFHLHTVLLLSRGKLEWPDPSSPVSQTPGSLFQCVPSRALPEPRPPHQLRHGGKQWPRVASLSLTSQMGSWPVYLSLLCRRHRPGPGRSSVASLGLMRAVMDTGSEVPVYPAQGPVMGYSWGSSEGLLRVGYAPRDRVQPQPCLKGQGPICN